MAISKKSIVWVASGIGLMLLGLYGFRSRTVPEAPATVVEPELEGPGSEPTFGPSRRLGMIPGATAAPASVPSTAPSAKLRPTGVPCTTSEDCRGGRPQAPCIALRCVDGQCHVDDSACECRRSEDCEDYEPCTRNHCFVPTMKCIFIRENCD